MRTESNEIIINARMQGFGRRLSSSISRPYQGNHLENWKKNLEE
jgi:hypothetical protein